MAFYEKRAIWIIVILFLLSGIVYVGYTHLSIMNPESLFEPQEPEEEDVVPSRKKKRRKRKKNHHLRRSPVEEYRFDEKG